MMQADASPITHLHAILPRLGFSSEFSPAWFERDVISEIQRTDIFSC
jgi:hypothetical protein